MLSLRELIARARARSPLELALIELVESGEGFDADPEFGYSHKQSQPQTNFAMFRRNLSHKTIFTIFKRNLSHKIGLKYEVCTLNLQVVTLNLQVCTLKSQVCTLKSQVVTLY